MAGNTTDAVEQGEIPFACPAVFDHAQEVELEDGLYVTCEELKPLYELPPLPVDTDVV